jgi:predicted methyltransferase
MKNITILLFLLYACTNPTWADTRSAMETRIQTQMAAPDRHQWDLRRDEHRKPFATFQFLGLEEGMTVLDVAAYAGYTTEMLAAAVGPEGKVYCQNTSEGLERYADGYYESTIRERLENDRLANVVLHVTEYDDLGLEGEVNLAFLGNMIHDFHYRDGDEQALAFLRSIFRALKPGGVLGVMDHVGDERGDNAALHRIEPHIARGLIQQAGFVIEAESDLFANPDDDHLKMVYDKSVYLRTDKFLFRARKPSDQPDQK